MRIDALSFEHPAALYRAGDTGVAVIARTTSVESGPGWATVIEEGAGIALGHLYLEYHSGDAVVYRVDGSASADFPGEAHLDTRLQPLGEYFEVADADQARREAVAAAQKSRVSTEAIRAATFHVSGELDGRRWSIEVGPTLLGSTRLALRSDSDFRRLDTSAPREALERASTTAVQIEATEWVDRGRFDWRVGRRPRTVQVTLAPAEPTA